MITIHAFGKHAHRQPLAYAPIRAACGDRLRLTDDPDAADILLLAHPRNLLEAGDDLRDRLGEGQRLVLLSEEPFWDSIWGAAPHARDAWHATPSGAVPMVTLNHATSDIYDFAHIPYFLLTDRTFWNRYGARFATGARRSAAQWRADWAARPLQAAFAAEKRTHAKFDARRGHGPGAMLGLSSLRSRIALCFDGAGDVARIGRGWKSGPLRTTVDDWHLDKLTRLDGRPRLMSAIENTRYPTYVTEKLFDAFAIGALPVYVGGPGHRVHDIAPAGSWIDVDGMEAQAAADLIRGTQVAGHAADYVAAQTALADLFSDAGLLAAEYDRLANALVRALAGALDG